MDKSATSLCQFFGLDADHLTDKERSDIELSENAEHIRAQMEVGVKGSGAFPEIISQLKEISNISVVDIMLGAWKKSSELVKKLEESTQQPKESISFPIGEHTITSQHQPYVEVIVNGKSAGRIDFELNIDLTLKGFNLSIQNGEIRSIRTGSCEAKGNVKCGGAVIKEKAWEPMLLPGKIILDDDTTETPPEK